MAVNHGSINRYAKAGNATGKCIFPGRWTKMKWSKTKAPAMLVPCRLHSEENEIDENCDHRAETTSLGGFNSFTAKEKKRRKVR